MACVLAVAALPVSAAAQDAAEDAFRPACELASGEQVREIVGAALSQNDLGPQFCAWEGEGVSVFVTLDETAGLELLRMITPEAQDLSIAGREAISSPAGEGIPATVVVALDEAGVLRVQVSQGEGVPQDPVGAAIALAEAIFASGPVLPRPPRASSGPSLGYSGPPCELVTLDEVRQATGLDGFSTATQDNEQSCTYGSDDFMLLASVAITEGELFLFSSGSSVDLTVGGRPAVWSPEMLNSLFVDIGGGRLLQVALLLLQGDPAELQAQAQALAEMAMGRLEEVGEPAPATAPPAGPSCDLLSPDEVAAITGLPFTRADDTDSEGTSCSYSTDDPGNEPYFLIVARADIDDPATALELFAQDMAGLPEPEAVEVGGHPALRGGNEAVSVAVVDLDGLPGEEGRVLAVVWFFPPADVDAGAVVIQLAESALGSIGGSG